MSDLDDLSFACKKVISVKEEVEICETQLLEQIFDRFEVPHVDPCVKIEKGNTEDNQTELNDCEGIREQPYECYLRPDDSTSSARKHDDIRPSLKNNRTCSICAKSFRSSSRLEVHMNVHTGSRLYACTICPRKYASNNGLRAHILTHGSGFKCTFCEKSYKSRSGMNKHIKIHRGEPNFQCEICSKSFTSKYLLSSHHKTHSDKKKYECTLCSEKFAENSTRLRHEKTHTNNHSNYYECENCKKYFRTEDQYRSHMKGNKCKGYASEKPFECSKCENESFVSIELLNQHKVEVHPPSKKNHACSVCTKAYRYDAELRVHMNVHTGKRPYACTICSKAFIWPSNLRKHMLTHSAEAKNRSKFKCTLCEKLCSSRGRLNSHMNMHRGERAFKCDTCPKTFMSPDTLSSHKKLHADDRENELCNQESTDNNKPFQCSKCENESFVSIELLNQHKVEVHPPPKKNHACSICEKSFRSSSRLKVHMNVHTGNRPYACTICSKAFIWPSNLRRHKLTHNFLRAERKIRHRFKCTLCEKSYYSKTNLNSHMHFHRGERPFKCEICPKSYTSAKSLGSHINTHSDEKKVECTLCNLKCRANSERRKHEKTHTNRRTNYQCEKCKLYFRLEDQHRSHLEDNKCRGYASEKPFECSKCENESFVSIELLNQHILEVHPPSKKNHACSVCTKAYRYDAELRVHMNVHTGKRPYACTICSKAFIWPSNLRKHMLTHSAEAKNRSKFKCTLCEKLCSSRGRLNSHMNMHRGERPFKCDTCPKTFMSPDTLSSHKKLHADDRENELCNQESTDNNKPFQCSKCENESFVSIELLNQHKVEVHPPPKKNHACSICEKSFRSSSRLKVHMNVHTGNRPYACTICSKAFIWPSNLRRHKLTHNAERKIRHRFKCTLCEKSYFSKTNLNSHMYFHRGERPFKCEICPKSYTSAKSLGSHINTHSDEKKFECTLCNLKCRANSERRIHEKTHTNRRTNYQCEKCKLYFRLKDQHRSHLEDNKCKGYASEKPFECSECENESFVSIELLNQHKVEFNPPSKKNHICLICTKTYKLKCLLDIHMNSHTGSRPYTCPICPKRFACPGSLNRHKLDHNFLSADGKIRGRFKCTLCEKSYSSKISLNSHMYFHRGERPFKCEICPKSYMNPHTLKWHIKTHFDEKKFECTLCNLKCRGNSKRRIHEKTHTNRRMNYQCEKCKLYFRLEDQHRSHLEDNKCKGYASEKPFECSKCKNESFVSIELLNQHKVEVHRPPKRNHACSICEKSFRSSSRLKVHMNVHTGNRPYKCTVCPKKYGCPTSLRYHKLTHSLLSADRKIRGRFKCTLCEKSYFSKIGLNSHMYFHRGERPFKCEICPKSYRSAISLRSHVNTHSDEKKFECTLCNLKCRGNSKRRIHEKTHTNRRMNFQCEKCKLYFRLEDQHRSHLEDNKCKGYASENPFQCPKCDNETFASIELLNQHKVEVHPPPKKDHACSICAKAYRRKSELDIHMNYHRGKRPFKCEVCSKPFWSNELLLKHNKTHFGRKYECTMCNKKFTDNSNRRQHEKTHSNRRERYHCITCKKYFKLEDQFRSHYQDNKCEGNSQELHAHEKGIQAQNEIENIGTAGKSQNDDIFEKKYKCDECNKEFICKRNLNFHLRSHLPISST